MTALESNQNLIDYLNRALIAFKDDPAFYEELNNHLLEATERRATLIDLANPPAAE